MQRLLSGSLIVCALAMALPAAAQVEHPPVPVEKAAYHWPEFSNEYVMLLRVGFYGRILLFDISAVGKSNLAR